MPDDAAFEKHRSKRGIMSKYRANTMIKNQRLALLRSSLIAVLAVSFGVWLYLFSLDSRLIQAARNADLGTLKHALAWGAQINSQDKYGETALIAATRQNRPTIVLYLLDKGADANIANRDGQTPLMNAAQFGYRDIAQILLVHGAKVNTWDANANTALSDAVSAEHLDIARLLLAHGATPTPDAEASLKKTSPWGG